MQPRDLWSAVRIVFRAATALSVASLIVSNTLAFAQAELPRAYVDTTYAAPNVTPIVVNSGGDLQTALNTAAAQAGSAGSIVQLQNGAVFTGNFVLPAQTGTGWIYVVSSALANLPAGTRVSPAQASSMPRIESPNSDPALQTVPGTHHFRLVGVEVTVAPSVSANYALVSLGDGSSAQNSLSLVPHHLILDRVYVHGNGTVDLRRGVSLQSSTSAVIDSYISDVHEVGADSQAIAGWNGPGPYKIANNRLEGAAENIMFGGGNPFIDQLVPSDIEVRGNHLFKPLSWNIGHPSYAGIPWTIKNLFELKNAQRVLIEGNVLENNWWCPNNCQNGFAVLFTPRNQIDGPSDPDAPWSVVADVTFRHNIVRSSQVNGQPEQGGGIGGGFNILGRDNNHPTKGTERIVIRDNVLEDVQAALGTGWAAQILPTIKDVDHPVGYPNRVTIDHNTAFHDTTLLNADSWPDVPPNNGKADGFVFNNNLAPKGVYGIHGTETNEGLPTLNAYVPGYTVNKDLIQGADCALYPAGTFCPATFDGMFVDQPNHNYRLSAGSPYRGAGTDLQDIGADIDGVDEATAGAVSGAPPSVVPVTWTNLVNVTANGNSLTKTSGVDGSWDAGAVSTQTIASGDGYVEFTIPDVNSLRAGGLSHGNTNATLQDIDFALVAEWTSPCPVCPGINVYENGTKKAFCGEWFANTVLRVAVGKSGQVKYYKDGVLCYTSASAPTYPLLVDTSIWARDNVISNVVMRTGP